MSRRHEKIQVSPSQEQVVVNYFPLTQLCSTPVPGQLRSQCFSSKNVSLKRINWQIQLHPALWGTSPRAWPLHSQLLLPEAVIEAADNANQVIQYLAPVGHKYPSADVPIKEPSKKKGVLLCLIYSTWIKSRISMFPWGGTVVTTLFTLNCKHWKSYLHSPNTEHFGFHSSSSWQLCWRVC